MQGKSTPSDMFYEKVLKAKDIAVLAFADLVQRLLVDDIRDVLVQPESRGLVPHVVDRDARPLLPRTCRLWWQQQQYGG